MCPGRPPTVFARTNQPLPEEFPEVEGSATIVLEYVGGAANLGAAAKEYGKTGKAVRLR